jgi:hypothetical protein
LPYKMIPGQFSIKAADDHIRAFIYAGAAHPARLTPSS